MKLTQNESALANFLDFDIEILSTLKIETQNSINQGVLLNIENEISGFKNCIISKTNKILKKINQLSGGELRYLEIKLILCNDSKFALLDEPYNGISPILVKEINRLIIKYSSDKGIILTDHNYRNVLDVANQLYVIKDCATKKLKDKEELIKYGYLKEGML